MCLRPIALLLLFGLLIPTLASSQSSPSAPEIAADPMEPVTGEAKVVSDPELRSAVLNLVEHARQNNELHGPGMPMFVMKVTFTSAGESRYLGAGEMEETWGRPGRMRWTARLGDYSQLRIVSGSEVWDEHPSPIPLRIHMIRGALFNPIPGNWSHATLRVSSAVWQGTQLTCVLTSGWGAQQSSTPGRRWQETEFCIDPQTSLLRIYSQAPGIYAVMDYHDALVFHGRTLPRQIEFTEAGTKILQVRINSLADAGNLDPKLFVPPQAQDQHEQGAVISQYQRMQKVAPAPAGYLGQLRPVIVNCSVDSKGAVMEAEALQMSIPELAAAAVEFVKQSHFPAESEEEMPRQRQAFVTVYFAAAQSPRK